MDIGLTARRKCLSGSRLAISAIRAPYGPSQIVDPSAFIWTDERLAAVSIAEGQVIYEMHVGSFTSEGTYAAAAEQLAEELAEVGRHGY